MFYYKLHRGNESITPISMSMVIIYICDLKGISATGVTKSFLRGFSKKDLLVWTRNKKIASKFKLLNFPPEELIVI